jgi:hypothetical protein
MNTRSGKIVATHRTLRAQDGESIPVATRTGRSASSTPRNVRLDLPRGISRTYVVVKLRTESAVSDRLS